MSEILYKICGNKFSNEGFKTIAGSSEIRIEDCEPQVNGLYYYAFRHETAQEVYIMRRYDVKSCDASRDGRMAVAIAIPYGWQLAGGKSPYDLLTELWATYRDRYMEWGEISKIWKFRADEEDESLFKQLLAEYPLRRFNGRQPMPMRGADCGWQKLNREEDIQDIMRDTRHKDLGLENYSEVVLTVDGNDYRPMVGIRGAYQPQYQVYCNDKSAAVLSSSQGLIVVKPEYDKTCECADDVPITYDEIERARRACPDNDIYEYKSGNATVIVDFVQERIDCKISIEPRQITYQVILGGGSMREIEEQDNVRFLIQDFDIIVGAQLVSVDEECKFTLVGRSISEAISVKLRSGDDRYEVTSDVVSGNNVRYINIYVTRKAVVVTSAGATDRYNRVDGNSGDVAPHVPNRRYAITFKVDCRTQDKEDGVEVRFECKGHVLKGTTQPDFGYGKIQITDESFIKAIEEGACIYVTVSGESYKEAKIEKKDFNKNGEATVKIDRRKSVFSNQYLLISLFAVAIIGIGIFAYNIFSTDDAPQPNPDTLVALNDNSDDTPTFKDFMKIIGVGEGEGEGEREEGVILDIEKFVVKILNLQKSDTHNLNWEDSDIEKMSAYYEVVKILDDFNMVESENGGYVRKGINGKNEKDTALTYLTQYRERKKEDKIEDEALAGIIDAFLAKNVPIIAATRDSTFYGESIKEWAEFCNKVTTKVKDEENAKRKASKTDESKVVEPRKDTSKDQTKKAAPESEYTVKIGEKDYTMEGIVELLKNPKTEFSVIFSICDKYDSSDEDFKTKCEEYKVTDILNAYKGLKDVMYKCDNFKTWIINNCDKDNKANKREMWGDGCWGCFEVAYIRIQTDSPKICCGKSKRFEYDEEKEIEGQNITIKSDLVMEHIHSNIFSCKSLYDFRKYANEYVTGLLNSKTNEDNKNY